MSSSRIEEIVSDDDELILSPSNKETIPESSANVSSAIMLKVPTYNLASLREDFEREAADPTEEREGLDIEQFLRAFTRNMELESDRELLEIVPDLVDFFNLVDINGDGEMQWSEFVMFVIEQVVQSEGPSQTHDILTLFCLKPPLLYLLPVPNIPFPSPFFFCLKSSFHPKAARFTKN